MANWRLNALVKSRQIKALILVSCIFTIVMAIIIVFMANAQPKKHTSTNEDIDLTGIVDESFTQDAGDKAMLMQQTQLESLKKQISQLSHIMKEKEVEHKKELQAQKDAIDAKVQELVLAQVKNNEEKQTTKPQNQEFWHNNNYASNNIKPLAYNQSDLTAAINVVSFRKAKRIRKSNNYYHLNPKHYVPSNTSVRAVILGGADADASVNGQAKNNGVMLFKFLEDGTLPNGQHSRLKGCRVSANSYGDISSERAFATLYHLSCAHPGEPIIDKEITGWVFFNGKVGIKGKPLMRDNKVMTWAGVSGALSGIASAAQYAQSVQAIGPYGATSIVPSSQIGPFAAYGGASKAADTLSSYYVKRAEQYHPVIQVGSGNVVTVVFKDGFYLEPDDSQKQYAMNQDKSNSFANAQEPGLISDANNDSSMNFTVPPEVLGKIDSSQLSQNPIEALQ